jgi:hypothetical protein
VTTPSTQDAPAVDLPEIDGGAVRITAKPQADPTRVVVAYVGDTPITVPKQISGSSTLAFLQVYRRAGLKVATVWMFEDALGTSQLEALHETGMTPEQLLALMEKIGKLYQGQVDELLGN